MGSTNALFTGLSGLLSNQRRLDVIGNNIANVNTTAFKSSRMIFSTLYSQATAPGGGPSGFTAGTNPTEVGHGAQVAGTQRNFAGGAITATGILTDMAIEGDGFFVANLDGQTLFTRDGAFQLNADRQLVTAQGAYVLGWGLDEQGQIRDGVLERITIPLGATSLAEATRTVYLDGNLNAAGDPATTGSIHASQTLFTDVGLTTTLGWTWDPDDPSSTGGPQPDLTVIGNNLYVVDGDGLPSLALEGGAQAVITVEGIEKNGQNLGRHRFLFGTAAEAAAAGITGFGTTMADFTDWLQPLLGLTGADGEADGGRVEIDPAGTLTIIGNHGTVQGLDLSGSDITVDYLGAPQGEVTAGMPVTTPFSFESVAEADGESVRTTFVAYDSLGNAVTVHLSMVLEEILADGGSRWSFIAESPDVSVSDRVVGIGGLTFDASGTLVSSTGTTLSLTLDNGADSPLELTLDLDEGVDGLTGLSDSSTAVAARAQDGFPPGELTSFLVGSDGVITGSFTNGATRTLGRLALAVFANPAGLEDVGDNFYRVGPNSGEAVITVASTLGAGRIIGSALEGSNVDLSQEFVNMILASTGYQASSRVINASNEMLDQLMLMAR